MNWYKTAKIDSFAIEYWNADVIKVAKISDWWQGIKEDFSDRPLMRGVWGFIKNSFAALGYAFMTIATPIGSMFTGDEEWLQELKEFFTKTVTRIGKMIYTAVKMGYGGVKLLKDLANMIRTDLGRELELAIEHDMKSIYESHLQKLVNRKEMGVELPTWYTKNPKHFSRHFRIENKEVFDAIDQGVENLALKIEDFADRYERKLAA